MLLESGTKHLDFKWGSICQFMWLMLWKKEKLHYVAASSIQDGENARQTLDQILLELLELFFNLSGFWLLLTLSVVVHRLFCLMIKKKKNVLNLVWPLNAVLEIVISRKFKSTLEERMWAGWSNSKKNIYIYIGYLYFRLWKTLINEKNTFSIPSSTFPIPKGSCFCSFHEL